MAVKTTERERERGVGTGELAKLGSPGTPLLGWEAWLTSGLPCQIW